MPIKIGHKKNQFLNFYFDLCTFFLKHIKEMPQMQNGIFGPIVQYYQLQEILTFGISFFLESCGIGDTKSWLYSNLCLFPSLGFHPWLQEEYEHWNFPQAVQEVSQW